MLDSLSKPRMVPKGGRGEVRTVGEEESPREGFPRRGSEGWRRAESTRHSPLTLSVDANTMSWLEREARRTGLGVDRVAVALLRKSCGERTELDFGPKANGGAGDLPLLRGRDGRDKGPLPA